MTKYFIFIKNKLRCVIILAKKYDLNDFILLKLLKSTDILTI